MWSASVAAQYNTAPGISASDYVTDLFAEFGGFGVGPVGLVFDPQGDLFVTDYASGQLYKIAPGGGSVGSLSSVFFVIRDLTRPTGLAFNRDGRLFMAEQGYYSPGDVVEIDLANRRTIGPPIATNIPSATGLAVDPLSDDLFVSGAGGSATIYRISNYKTGSATVTPYANVQLDGIAFAPDGTLYGSGTGGMIYSVPGTNIAGTGPWPGTLIATVVNAQNLPAPVDGIALGAGGQAQPPFLYVNRNDGIITKIDLTTTPPTQLDILTGGTRGDLVTVDSQGCLFATQSTTIVKLTDPAGACNPPLVPTSAPPPPTIVLTPDWQSVPVGALATLEATVADAAGNPQANVIVSFNVVSGPDSGVGNAIATNALGRAAFSYVNRSNIGGSDTVQASFTDNAGATHSSNTATVVLDAPAPPPPLPGLPGNAQSFQSPDFKIVRYIKTFDSQLCAADVRRVLGVGPVDAQTACDLLLASANPNPPASFDNHGWKAFEASDQYRAIVHLPPVHVTCSPEGKITAYDQGQQVEKGFEVSPGYTPSVLRGSFDPAETYQGSLAGLFNDLDFTVSPNQDFLVVSYLTASRIATTERGVAYKLLGYDAPFVWTVVRERITCSTYNLVVVNSDFPSTNVYVDDQVKAQLFQTGQVGLFTSSGGKGVYHDAGMGFLDPRCDMLEFKTKDSAPVPLPPADTINCAQSIVVENWPYFP